MSGNEIEFVDLTTTTERTNRYAEYERLVREEPTNMEEALDFCDCVHEAFRGLREVLEWRPWPEEWLFDLAKSEIKPVNWRRDGF